MRQVKWTDEAGYKHLSLVRDGDPDDKAPQGLWQDPPDLHGLDWEVIIREIHNLLVDRGLITWRDVQTSQNGVSAIIRTVLTRQIINLYKLQEVE